MSDIDQEILTNDEHICKNIRTIEQTSRGFVAQNILGHIRTLVENISLKIYSTNREYKVDYSDIQKALEFIRTQGKYNFLVKFHNLLQVSVSHYILNEDGSERILLKYYEYLLKIKKLLKDEYGMDILNNIGDFPLEIDSQLKEYYMHIVEVIENTKSSGPRIESIYYIHKVKPFFKNQEIYYEITFTPATDYISKFDRVIAFSKLEIMPNYAVRLNLRRETVNMFGVGLSILIVDDWNVSIRPCELINFAKIFNINVKIQRGHQDYRQLMNFLTDSKINLLELILFKEQFYVETVKKFSKGPNPSNIEMILDKAREYINKDLRGSNLIRYLLFKLNNKVIKNQLDSNMNPYLSMLKVKYQSIPFSDLPFSSAPYKHLPRFSDILECMNYNDYQYDLFAKYLINKTELDNLIYIKKDDIKDFDSPEILGDKYNSVLYEKHHSRRIEKYKDYFYIQKYETEILYILKKLMELADEKYDEVESLYSVDFLNWLDSIDCYQKREILQEVFKENKVIVIYGAAGTGKTTLVNYLAQLFRDQSKMFIANTNPAVENLRSRIEEENSEFKTITKFLNDAKKYNYQQLLFIDECSTVSNEDFAKILKVANFDLIVLVGDVYQIESVNFGNWFNLIESFLPKNSIHELKTAYRTSNPHLIAFWDEVRGYGDKIQEIMARRKYSTLLDETVFEKMNEDEIILCLNYDGLYGINNINRIMQSNNPNQAYSWGVHTFKVNDPILFNESNRFAPAIYNNLKGRIKDIRLYETYIEFEVEVEKIISIFELMWKDCKLIETTERGTSIINFTVNKYKMSDEDDDSDATVIPFQVAYAVSIHKAQGLEYESVKVIITHEVEDLISHNIFYTAITRSKNKLRIYWTSESELKIISSFKKEKNNRDKNLLKLKLETAESSQGNILKN